MRTANHEGRLILVTDAGGIDVETASAGRFGPDPHAVYAEWDDFRTWAAATFPAGATPSAATVTIDEHLLGAPSPRPTQVFAIGLNYRAHAAETGAKLPPKPATFTKFPTCITGPVTTVELPSGNVDWEVELVVVIGRRAHRVAAADAWDHVAGLTAGQDLSERVVQRASGGHFSLGKSFPGFGPTGPWLVTPDEFADPDDIELGCRVDGEEVQKSRTSDLVFDVPALIAELSAILPLLPGDLIFTGTPSGVGAARTPPRFLQPGEELVSWIEGIGTLRNRFVTASPRLA